MRSAAVMPPDALREFVTLTLRRAGVSARQSQLAADSLMWASLRGVDTHGVRNLKSMYVDRILDGTINLDAELIIEQETAGTARADGAGGLGIALAADAMHLAVEKAAATGVGAVNVRNSHHLGAAGCFAAMAVEHGQIGFCLTGEFFAGREDFGIAPINSLLPLFSTNPLSCAAPCGRHAPFVLDMSTSVTCLNRIQRFAELGKSIPPGWAADAAGRPTSDPAAARVLTPLGGTSELGGHKGVGLAMTASILSAVLSGAWAPEEFDGPYRQRSKAHFFAAIRIDQFLPLEDFARAMDAMIDAVRNAPRENPDEPIYYPGDKEHQTYIQRRRSGVPVTATELDDLRALSQAFNVPLPG